MIIDILTKKLNEILDYGISFRVIPSNRPELCDYQSDDVFKLAKLEHKSPIELGNKIVEEINQIDDFSSYFNSVTFAPPGFINIKVSEELINHVLEEMNEKPKFNLKTSENVETFVLDYGGPNIAKPLHVGHMRTAIVGESIKRIIKYMGHKTISDVHLGDYGLQIGQVIYGIQQDHKKIEDITLDYLEQTYPKISGLCKENDEIKEEHFLIDATYRQFFTKEKCSKGMYYMDKTPDPGYFVKNKVFAKELIKNGFIKLNEEVAKEYGEPFYLSSLKLGEKPNKKINYYDNIINSNEDYKYNKDELEENDINKMFR